MIKISLYNLDNPILIVPEKTGVVYYNQRGGCGCYQKEIEGYIIPLPYIDPMEFPVFNRHVWYCKGGVDLPPKYIPNNKSNIFELTLQQWRDMEEGLWWDDICNDIQGLSNKEDWNGPFMKVVKNIPQMESWLKIKWKNNKKDRYKDGVLTWQNCD